MSTFGDLAREAAYISAVPGAATERDIERVIRPFARCDRKWHNFYQTHFYMSPTIVGEVWVLDQDALNNGFDWKDKDQVVIWDKDNNLLGV